MLANNKAWLGQDQPTPFLRHLHPCPTHHNQQGWGQAPALFAEFRRRYRAELCTNSQAVAQIATIAQQHDVTLLYAAKDADGNHAIVLAEFLRDQGVGD